MSEILLNWAKQKTVKVSEIVILVQFVLFLKNLVGGCIGKKKYKEWRYG